ncbi:hypothetical protein FXN61_35965 [Lentzea sp. PSKA42]|uniref:Uncharacterized protein n=1 Tax=Lentzea indica TaxID=2604800 RepID=A0ABX1FTL1_9PSEU|nr:hypothetical protein [Lentzea indica]NKE61867.1 hypothetical protein [Lentzea indica]
MKHSDQSTDNEIDGDVRGTSFQAGSIEINVGTPRKLRRSKRLRYLVALATAVVSASALVLVRLMGQDEPGKQLPEAAGATTPAETVTTSSGPSAAGAPVTSTAAGAARPAPVGQAPRTVSGTPIAGTPAPTTTVSTAPSPAGTGVRFSGALQFGSFHLDLAEPRDKPGMNVWPLTPNRLHGDDGYWLTEWLGDGVPGQPECAAELGKRATRDAENLIVGSRVCGKTPAGRIFLVDVAAMDGTTITGQVTVWE